MEKGLRNGKKSAHRRGERVFKLSLRRPQHLPSQRRRSSILHIFF